MSTTSVLFANLNCVAEGGGQRVLVTGEVDDRARRRVSEGVRDRVGDNVSDRVNDGVGGSYAEVRSWRRVGRSRRRRLVGGLARGVLVR